MIYTTLTKKRANLRLFFNRTKKLWTIQVMDPDDLENVVDTFHTNNLENLQPSYSLESSPGILQTFGILRKRLDKDELQITNF